MGWARSGEGQMGEARDKVDRKKGGEDQKWGESEVDSTIWVGPDWRSPYGWGQKGEARGTVGRKKSGVSQMGGAKSLKPLTF